MIEETIPTGSTITYQGIDYTTEAEVNVLKVVAPTADVAPEVADTPAPEEIVAPEAAQPSVEDVTIAPNETIEITEAA